MTTLYVEGAGDGRALRSKCREGFHAYFGKAGLSDRLPKIIAAGSRGTAYNKFRSAMSQVASDEFVVLLVDSEGPVPTGPRPWTHLKQRDNWDKPTDATDDNAHLMVQCMEAWFLADRQALGAHFGRGFSAKAIPANPNIEEVSKRDIESAIKKATRRCARGSYNKGRDSFAILGKLDPQKVTKASPHAARLVRTLRSLASK